MEPSTAINDEKKPQFDHTKEFEALRSEILAELKDERSLERYVLVTTGAIWAWLITHHITARQPWAIPIALVLVASLRALSIVQHLGTIGEYIRTELEPDGRGFEHFLEQKRTIAPRWRRVVRFGSDYGSWICLFLFNTAGLEWGPRLSCLAATKPEGIKLPF